MRAIISGGGVDMTSTVLAAIRTRTQIYKSRIFLLGQPENPNSLWMTAYDSPLRWSLWGTFLPGVMQSDAVESKIGLDVAQFKFVWSPKNNTFGNTVDTASPAQKVRMKLYDNLPFYSWTVWMPTPGDADTWGCSQLFGGRVAGAVLDRGEIQFTITSFLDVVKRPFPANVIELFNTAAGYKGAVKPYGLSNIPTCNVIQASPTQLILQTQSPLNHVFPDNKLLNGYVMFNSGAGQTLGGNYSAIASNTSVVIGSTTHNKIQLYQPLPWPPTPGSDTCFISGPAPMNQTDGDYVGFPYVPAPETAV